MCYNKTKCVILFCMEELDIKSRLSNNLKNIRKEKGLSQFELAEKANISEQTINSIESKRLWPSDKTLSKITTALEIDIFKLFFPEKDSGFPSKELDTDLSHSVVQSIRNLVESTLREYTK